MTHTLKTWAVYFQMQEQSRKPWELRRFDRPYKIGDTFISQEYDNEKQQYTGKENEYIITYILSDAEQFGLMPGYCILSLKNKEPNY